MARITFSQSRLTFASRSASTLIVWLIAGGIGMGCAASPKTGLGIRIQAPQRWEGNIVDAAELSLVFTNNTNRPVVLPVGLIGRDTNLFIRMSGRDPIDRLRSLARGHRDRLTPFTTFTPEHEILHPGESYAMPLRNSHWTQFMFDDHAPRETLRYFMRVSFSAAYPAGDELDTAQATADANGGSVWQTPVISRVHRIEFTKAP